jgi:predicted nucleic acid-binding protein
MRLVVDTNVLVSAALKENSLPFLVFRWIANKKPHHRTATTRSAVIASEAKQSWHRGPCDDEIAAAPGGASQ